MNPRFLIVDLFCGAGGTSTGFEKHPDCMVIACVNHDANAIRSHEANHPDTIHFTEDIRNMDMVKLQAITNQYRNIYPDALLILWASLECTNFSKAKGGQPRDADSRSLADHMPQYINALQPDYFMVENVVEFMSWGPLDDNGKPVSRKNGCDFLRWCREIDSLGYVNQWKELNSANYGAYTSRNRLFGIFATPGLPIVWPQATHSKNASHSLHSESLKKWMPVKDVLDFTDEGESIFNRKKQLSDKTFERIYAGLIKFIAGGKSSFIVKYNSYSKSGKYIAPGMDEPCPVVSTQNRLGAAFIQKYYSGRPEGKVISIDSPAGTITTIDSQSLVTASFIGNYYGNGFNTSLESPLATLRTKDSAYMVNPSFIMRDFSATTNQSIDSPAGAVMPSPKLNLVNASFVMPTNYNNKPTSIEEPSQTITANRKHHYLVNPSHGGNASSIEEPSPVVIARQDKAPLYLIECNQGNYSIPVYDSDTDIVIKVKQFMSMYGIVDIKMRMLKIPELLKIQGFPDGYKLIGTQAEQKKYIGNSVHTIIPYVMAEALLQKLKSIKFKAA